MNEKKKKVLAAKFSDGTTESEMTIATIGEWDDANRGESFGKEIGFISSISVTSCSYCGSG